MIVQRSTIPPLRGARGMYKKHGDVKKTWGRKKDMGDVKKTCGMYKKHRDIEKTY